MWSAWLLRQYATMSGLVFRAWIGHAAFNGLVKVKIIHFMRPRARWTPKCYSWAKSAELNWRIAVRQIVGSRCVSRSGRNSGSLASPASPKSCNTRAVVLVWFGMVHDTVDSFSAIAAR